MVQSKRLVNALKETLKSRDITYAEVAGHLGLSLSSVKRQFSTQRFSLHRLEQVCDLAGIDLLELARLAEERRLRVAALTEDQERQLVSDPALLLTTVCVLNRWTFERIVERYGFPSVQLTNLLVRLDRIGLIELLPAKRIRLRVARNFAWLPGGPIHRYFVDRVQGEFLSGEFDPDRDLHRFSWGMLSDPSAAQLRGKIAEVMDAFDDLTRRDEVRADAAAAGTCFLVALRRWEPTAFQSLRHSNLADDR
ncbi:MAG: helix-turn-helix domain-containing protein [Gammaproteobacteria bacterium]|nr:helix-turn-helix domain-containing protein [Gammaproteobacteria bacterium]MDE0246210.1 helix-turn-helix domain-containing protein [Gammaproteobacteria bacterium]